MVEPEENKLHKLEDLQTKLSSKSFKPKMDYRDGFTPRPEKVVPATWADEGEPLPAEKFLAKTSMFKKIFTISAIFFILSVGYAAFVMLAGSNTVSNENIDINIVGNNFTAGGEELELVVSIVNRNAAALELVDLIVEYPKGMPESAERERSRITVGTIPAGATHSESLTLVLFGEQGTSRSIKASIEYRVAGSNAIFVKEKEHNVSINSTPINLSVEAPLSASPNQDINLNVKTSLNATRAAEDVLVKLDYPLGFQFIKAVPSPSFGNNVWYLGDLSPGASHGIAITGKMVDVFDGEEKTFNIASGSQSPADKSDIGVVFNSTRHTIEIKKAFIEASISVNSVTRREYAVDSKTPLNFAINYANNLSSGVDNLVIEAKLSGNAWNRGSVQTSQGHYDSSRNIITWDSTFLKDLREVNPGESGSVEFTLSSLPLMSASGGLLSDPSINVEVNIVGRQSVEGATASELKNSASATLRLISNLNFSAKALYYSGPFQNTGPIPPKAEETTTYTITWSLSNTSNNVSKAQIFAVLPAWVSFAGTISPASEDVAYNSSTRTVIWNIGRVPRGTGISGASRSASFKVALKPSISQIGSNPILIDKAVLTGHDDFANVDVKAERSRLTTELTNDPMFPGNGGKVTE